PRSYAVFGGAIVAGALLGSLNVSAVRMMFLSAVLNGLLAAPLLVLVMLVGNNRKIMGRRVNDRWLNVLGWSATGIMTVATLLFFWTSLSAGGVSFFKISSRMRGRRVTTGLPCRRQ